MPWGGHGIDNARAFITLNPTSGPAGTDVTITWELSGSDPTEDLQAVTFAGEAVEYDVTGISTATFEVPEGATDGATTVYVQDIDEGGLSATFTVTS